MFAPLIDLIDCQHLYNLLNEGFDYAKINDPYYLYLLGKHIKSSSTKIKLLNQKHIFIQDCRPRNEYNESHIIISKNVKRVKYYNV